MDMVTAHREIKHAQKLADNELAQLGKHSSLSGRLGRAIDRELKARNLPPAISPKGHALSPGVARDEAWIERRGDNIAFLHGPTDPALPLQSELAFDEQDPARKAEGDASPDVHNIVLSGHGNADIRPEGALHEVPEHSLGMNFYTPLGGWTRGGSDGISPLVNQGKWSELRREYREHYAPGRFVPEHTLHPHTAEEALDRGDITTTQGYVRPGKNTTVVRVARPTPLSEIVQEAQQRFPNKKLLFHWNACRSDPAPSKMLDSKGKNIESNSGNIATRPGAIANLRNGDSEFPRLNAGTLKLNPDMRAKPAITPAITQSEKRARKEKWIQVEAKRKEALSEIALDLLSRGKISEGECESRLSRIYTKKSEEQKKKDGLSKMSLGLLINGRISEQEYEARLSRIYPGSSEQHEKRTKRKEATWALLKNGRISDEEFASRTRQHILDGQKE
ncbi:hypothetical protein V4890_22505 [Ralstonia solanacearum species complex bacterium KE056]|uniref:putative adhesin n=1 Tax=Ralstonia solanacearum species complex bacterium KE056 TaxID=3119585 RepID=UPI002FC29574